MDGCWVDGETLGVIYRRGSSPPHRHLSDVIHGYGQSPEPGVSPGSQISEKGMQAPAPPPKPLPPKQHSPGGQSDCVLAHDPHIPGFLKMCSMPGLGDLDVLVPSHGASATGMRLDAAALVEGLRLGT